MKQLAVVLMLVVIAQYSPNAVSADILKCRSRDGKFTFTDENCPPGTVQVGSTKESLTAQVFPTSESAKFFGEPGKLLSMDFENSEIRAILQVFSDFSGRQIGVDDLVTGNVDISFNDKPWDKALMEFLRRNQLGIIRVRTGFYVFPTTMSSEIASKRSTRRGL